MIDYKKILSVQVRDGVVTQSSKLWWHGENGAEFISLDKRRKAANEWENIVDFPLIYSLQEPEYELDNNGLAVYSYDYPYKGVI